MQKLRRLNGSTTVCSGHEYTLGNARFALSLEEDNPALTSRYEALEAARDQNQATVPSNLSDECATNPFLRADDPGLMAAVGMANATPDEVFAAIRSRKDNF